MDALHGVDAPIRPDLHGCILTLTLTTLVFHGLVLVQVIFILFLVVLRLQFGASRARKVAVYDEHNLLDTTPTASVPFLVQRVPVPIHILFGPRHHSRAPTTAARQELVAHGLDGILDPLHHVRVAALVHRYIEGAARQERLARIQAAAVQEAVHGHSKEGGEGMHEGEGSGEGEALLCWL